MAKGPSPRGEAGRRSRDGQAAAPWLEEVDAEPDGTSSATLIGRSTLWLILLGLLLLVSVVAAGVFMVARQDQRDIDALPPGAEIPLIRDPGPWKVAPEGPGVDGVPVEGQDQLLFGTGVGADPQARIALDALPEEPVERPPTPAPAPASAAAPTNLLPDALREAAPVTLREAAPDGRSASSPQPRPAVAVVPRPVAPRPAATPPAPAAGAMAAGPTASGIIQLGAFSSDARARAAWKSLSERFGYLAGLAPIVVPVASEGRTLYRLRTDAGAPAAATELCGRLKVAGESCALVGGQGR